MNSLIARLREIHWKSVRKYFLRTVAVVAVTGVLLWWIIPWFWPLPEGLSHYTPPGAVILDRNDEPIAHLPGREYYRGGLVEWDDIPEDFINATLVAEDKRFFTHGGLDLVALARAMKSNISAGRIVSGASTISQQLVKISSPRGKRNVRVKFREFFQARHLEMTYDKKKILNEYFNRLDYGNLREGASSAARFYYGKTLRELTLGECALLVSLPQSPSRLNPLKHPERALKRRNWVLDRLETEFGYPSGRIARAKNEPLVFSPENTSAVVAPHLMSRLLHTGASGIVKTTLDGALQREAQNIVLKELDALRDKEAGQAAVLVVDNATGEILVWVGSANRSDPRGGLLDGVLIPRSAGSTLKPFVYAMGFDRRLWAGYVLPDIPTLFRSGNGGDAPTNYNDSYRGPLTVRDALACSQNIPAMRALQMGGGTDAFIPYLQRLGFSTVTENSGTYGLGLAIGNAEVRLLDLVKAYAMLARGGEVLSLRLCQDTPFDLDNDVEQPVFTPRVSFVLADILSDKAARADAFGLNSPLNLPFRCAVKTGTSSDFRDNWCVGFTPEYTVGVWVGNFDFRPMKNVSGVSGAGPIFSRVMKELHKNRAASWFTPPDGLVKRGIDIRSGKLSTREKTPAEFYREEWAFSDRLPNPAKAEEYDADGKYILNSLYTDWYESSHNSRRDAYTVNRALWSNESIPKITSPAPNSLLIIDPELPRKGRFVQLKCNLPDGVRWTCLTLRIFRENGRDMVELMPGTHTLRVDHPELGIECEAVITVQSI